MPVRRESATPTTEDASSSEDEQDFLDSLTRKQVLEISEAFERGARGEATSSNNNSSSNQPANKRRRVDKGKGKAKRDEPEQAPGGFFVGGQDDDDDEEPSGGGFVRDTAGAGGGGFLLDEEDEDTPSAGGGGFLPERGSAPRLQPGSSSKPTKVEDQANSVLLDKIPSILESLDLDGDDSSILSIFENAAFEDQTQGGLQAVIKRKDFLKVAAILITQRDNDREQERNYIRNQKSIANSSKKGKEKAGTFVASGGGKGRAINIDANEVEDADEHDDSDPLILSTSGEDEEDDPFNRDNEDSDPWADEDEIEGAFIGTRGTSPPSKRRTTRSRAKDASPLSDLPSEEDAAVDTKGKKSKTKGKARQQGDGSGRYQLSSRQKEECTKMFQQFFAGNDKNRNQAISMAEIRYVATLLNEKISDEDVSLARRLSPFFVINPSSY